MTALPIHTLRWPVRTSAEKRRAEHCRKFMRRANYLQKKLMAERAALVAQLAAKGVEDWQPLISEIRPQPSTRS